MKNKDNVVKNKNIRELKSQRSFIVKNIDKNEIKEFNTKADAKQYIEQLVKNGQKILFGPWYYKNVEIVVKTHSKLVIK